jgi:hypothetical protein
MSKHHHVLPARMSFLYSAIQPDYGLAIFSKARSNSMVALGLLLVGQLSSDDARGLVMSACAGDHHCNRSMAETATGDREFFLNMT